MLNVLIEFLKCKTFNNIYREAHRPHLKMQPPQLNRF